MILLPFFAIHMLLRKLVAVLLQWCRRLVKKWSNGGPPEVCSTPLPLQKKVDCWVLMSSVNNKFLRVVVL
jgi:hypothetical protein